MFLNCGAGELLRTPWTARRLNQSILKEINPEYSFLEGLMLKLKLQYFGHMIQKAHSLEKTLILGKIKGRGRSGQQKMRWLDLINSMDLTIGFHQFNGQEFEQTPGDGERQGSLGFCSPWGHKEPNMTELLNSNNKYAYLRLLIFLPAILIPAWDSTSPVFHMVFSAYKLNNQGDSTQLCRTPFPILDQLVVPCPVLTVVSWPSYKFLRRQIRQSTTPIFLRIVHSWLLCT